MIDCHAIIMLSQHFHDLINLRDVYTVEYGPVRKPRFCVYRDVGRRNMNECIQ